METASNFEQMIQTKRNDLTTERIHFIQRQSTIIIMKDRILESDANIVGIYSTTARNTVSVAKAVFST